MLSVCRVVTSDKNINSGCCRKSIFSANALQIIIYILIIPVIGIASLGALGGN